MAREPEQTCGGIIRRPVLQHRPGAVIKNDTHIWKTLGHTDRLRDRLG